MRTFTLVAATAVATAAIFAAAYGHPHDSNMCYYRTAPAATPTTGKRTVASSSPGFMKRLRNEALVKFLLAMAKMGREENTGNQLHSVLDMVERSGIFVGEGKGSNTKRNSDDSKQRRHLWVAFF